jgi:hypothetical protein
VKNGVFSFGKTSAGVNGVALSESQMLSVTVVCAADWRNAQENYRIRDGGCSSRSKRSGSSCSVQLDAMAVFNSAGVGAGEPSMPPLQSQLAACSARLDFET